MAVDADEAAVSIRWGLSETLLALVLGLLLLSADFSRAEMAGKIQTELLNDNVTCKTPDYVFPDNKTSPAVTLSMDKANQRLLCKASKFYLKGINITWCKWSQTNHLCVSISEGITTDLAIDNEDNTFNVTSSLQLNHSLEHNVTYQCTVEHIRMSASWCCNITLPENGSEPKGRSWNPVCIVVPCLVVPVVIVAIILRTRKHCRKRSLNKDLKPTFTIALDPQVV